jgi:hypothetical protein
LSCLEEEEEEEGAVLLKEELEPRTGDRGAGGISTTEMDRGRYVFKNVPGEAAAKGPDGRGRWKSREIWPCW